MWHVCYLGGTTWVVKSDFRNCAERKKKSICFWKYLLGSPFSSILHDKMNICDSNIIQFPGYYWNHYIFIFPYMIAWSLMQDKHLLPKMHMCYQACNHWPACTLGCQLLQLLTVTAVLTDKLADSLCNLWQCKLKAHILHVHQFQQLLDLFEAFVELSVVSCSNRFVEAFLFHVFNIRCLFSIPQEITFDMRLF